MISRSSIRNLKHKAKKSVLIRIGRTESSKEDPAFKELLSNVNQLKSELKDMQQSARLVVVTGRQHNDSLEKFCGAGLKGEDMFNKEDTFLRILEDRVCLALGNIISKDVEMLSDSIVEYKTAKLKFDSAHFKTLKNMKKNGDSDSIKNADEIVESNKELSELKDSYVASKAGVFSKVDVLRSHLNTRVSKSLEELSEASDMQHHQMYCQYIKEKLVKTSKICCGGRKARSQSMIVNKRSSTDAIVKRNRAASDDVLRVEDEKMTMIDTRLFQEDEIKNAEIELDEQSEGVEHSVSVKVQAEQKDSVDIKIPADKPSHIEEIKVSASPREESL